MSKWFSLCPEFQFLSPARTWLRPLFSSVLALSPPAPCCVHPLANPTLSCPPLSDTSTPSPSPPAVALGLGSTAQHNSLKAMFHSLFPFSQSHFVLDATHTGCHCHPQILGIKVPTDHLLLFQHLTWQNTSSPFSISPCFCDAVCCGCSSSSCWLSALPLHSEKLGLSTLDPLLSSVSTNAQVASSRHHLTYCLHAPESPELVPSLVLLWTTRLNPPVYFQCLLLGCTTRIKVDMCGERPLMFVRA